MRNGKEEWSGIQWPVACKESNGGWGRLEEQAEDALLTSFPLFYSSLLAPWNSRDPLNMFWWHLLFPLLNFLPLKSVPLTLFLISSCSLLPCSLLPGLCKSLCVYCRTLLFLSSAILIPKRTLASAFSCCDCVLCVTCSDGVKALRRRNLGVAYGSIYVSGK